MSEYQYYEFLAIDRPLSSKQIEEVREFSTRAEISSTQFVNEYQWGDFRGDPETFLSRWFDIHVYVANWGTHRLMIGLPAESIDLKTWREYESESAAEIRRKGERIIIALWSETEDYEDWVEGERWMASLAPLRNELLSDDLRPLYLAWLAGVQDDEEQDDDDLSPPVPPGLGELTTAQQALVEFLRVDEDLLQAAARVSPAARPASADLAQWIAGLPEREKDQLLLEVACGTAGIGPKLLARFSMSLRGGEASDSGPRPRLRELNAAAREAREAHEAAERERAAREREKRRAAQAAAREKHLQELADRPEKAWQQVEQVLRLKQNKEYDNTVTLLRDLREVAQRQQALDAFRQRVRALREAHKGKYTFVQRLDKAGVDA